MEIEEDIEHYSTDEDDDFDFQNPRPYLFEPVFTEEELRALEQRTLEHPVVQSDADVRSRANANWWCHCGVCQPMPTEIESLCCADWGEILPSMQRCTEEDTRVCVTTNEDFTAMIHPAVLNFFFRRDKVNWKKKNTPSGRNGQLSTE